MVEPLRGAFVRARGHDARFLALTAPYRASMLYLGSIKNFYVVAR